MKPRDYQQLGIVKLANVIRTYGCGLDMSDTGTGKTYKALFIAQVLGLEALVICPLGVVEHWQKAAQQVGVKIRCTNYEKARRGTTSWIKKIGKKFRYDSGMRNTCLLIFDEVHRCQSSTSLQSRLLVDAKATGFPLLLISATPFESPLQLRSIGYALGLFPRNSWWNWCLAVANCKPGFFGGLEYKGGHAWMHELRQCIEHLCDRVRCRDLDWEILNKQTIWVKPEDCKALDQAYADLLEQSKADSWNPLTQGLRERQIIEHQKLQAISNLAQDNLEDGKWTVIFCNFKNSIQHLQRIFKEVPTSIITGDITGPARATEVQKFQDKKSKICLVMTQAGGEGIGLHDIHGDRPTEAILNLTYSSRQFIQAIGRPYRDGVKSPVTIKIPIAIDTMEETIETKLNAKLANLSALTDGDFLP